jgi:putative N-acetyltransferase (TIGR04045 family)
VTAVTTTIAGVAECRNVTAPGELDQHLAIRRQVFVAEQGIFTGDDRDQWDDDPATVHVIGYVDGVAAGTVRLYPLRREPGGRVLWQGDRLAVRPEFRRSHVGGPLVRYAVRTAGQLGGDRMIAHVQLANVVFFRYLGWAVLGEPELYQGVPHQQMTIGLDGGRGGGQRASRVTPSDRRSKTVAAEPPAASRTAPESSSSPVTAAVRP